MKKILFIAIILCFTVSVWSQQNMATLSYGYAFGNIQEIDIDLEGYRVNALFEFNPQEGAVAHGLSIGYVYTKGTDASGLFDLKVRTWPVFYAPKYMFGNEKFKGFVKGAIGMHFAKYMTEGILFATETNQAGIYAGAGAGAMYNFNKSVFLNLEYEWAFMGNTGDEDIFMNTASLGLGFRF